MTRNTRIALLGIAVVIVVVAVIVIGGGGSDDTKSSGPTTITVKDAKPVGGVKDVTFKQGGTVDLTIKSDTADEVHFHGYDVKKDVKAGGSAHFKFPAKIDGKFIVELEDHGVTLAKGTVEPCPGSPSSPPSRTTTRECSTGRSGPTSTSVSW